MPRELSIVDLLAIQSEGGKVKREDLPAEIKGVDELVAALNRIAEAKEAESEAQKSLAETIAKVSTESENRHVEILEAMSKQTEVILAAQLKRVPYEFEFQRDLLGQPEKIIAIPKKPN